MQRLKEAILTRGKAINRDVLLVDSFLNHQVDVSLMQAVGEEFARVEVEQRRIRQRSHRIAALRSVEPEARALSARNEELADEIRKRMFVFEDIITMDDRSVQRFLRDCDQRDLVLALKGSAPDVANKIFANMSVRMAQSIQDDLEITTNVRIRDVEDAQQRIVEMSIILKFCLDVFMNFVLSKGKVQ